MTRLRHEYDQHSAIRVFDPMTENPEAETWEQQSTRELRPAFQDIGNIEDVLWSETIDPTHVDGSAAVTVGPPPAGTVTREELLDAEVELLEAMYDGSSKGVRASNEIDRIKEKRIR